MIDSTFAYKHFVLNIDDDASVEYRYLRPSAGLNLDEPTLLISDSIRANALKEANYWLCFIETNINKGLKDKLSYQIKEYKKYNYCTGEVFLQVLSLMSIQLAAGTTIDNFEAFVDAIWTEVSTYEKKCQRRKSPKMIES